MDFLKSAMISTKVSVGFGVVLTLLLLIAAFGTYSLVKANTVFKQYRNLARQTNADGRIQANMLMTRIFAKNFVIDASDENVRGVQERARKTISMIEEARQLTRNPERLAEIDILGEQLRTYVAKFEAVTEKQAERNTMVKEELNVIGPETEQNLTAIMRSANADGDVEAAYLAGMVLRNLLLARLYTHRYLIENDEASYERVLAEFKELEEAQAELDASLDDPRRRELATRARRSHDAYARAVNKVHAVITKRNRIIRGDLDRIGPEVAAEVEKLKLSIKAEQDALGPEAEAAMDRAVTFALVVSFLAIAIGILAATLIGRGIARPVGAITESLEGLAQSLLTDSQEEQAGAAEQSAAVEETRQTFEGLLEASGSLNRIGTDVLGHAEVSHRSAQLIGARIQDLSTSAETITEIVALVKDIANKSEMLALNAALEGTKAGEAGRGFSLVAQQMQRLAEQVMESVKTIESQTGQITQASHGAVLAAEEAERVSRLTTDAAREISGAVGLQQASAEQISVAMNEISQVAGRNVESARQVVASSNDLLDLAARLRAMVGANG